MNNFLLLLAAAVTQNSKLKKPNALKDCGMFHPIFQFKIVKLSFRSFIPKNHLHIKYK